MKHMFFHGVPVMNKPTETQQEILREADSQIGLPSAPAEVEQEPSEVTEEEVVNEEEPPVIEAKVAPLKAKDNSGCSEWAAANPALAERVKPGQSCYGF